MRNNLFFTLLILAFSFTGLAKQTEIISFQHAGLTVHGVISKPDSNGKYPVIIIAPGTGANDRNCTLPMVGANVACLYPGLLNTTLYPYKELGDALTDSGYAVLRYDKLEYIYKDPATLAPITFHKLWLPVKSAINYVKTRSDVDTNQIILLGHSEGSSLIPYIAKMRNDIKALISVGGPRTPLDSMLAYQLPYFARTCGGDTTMANVQAAQILSYFTAIRNNTWNTSTPPLMGVTAATWSDYIEAVDSVSINYNRANRPSLFVGLGLDVNVPPSELARFQNEVTVTNDFWTVANLNHYMTTNTVPHVSKQLTDTIVYWLRHKLTHTDNVSKNTFLINASPNPFTENLNVSIKNIKSKEVKIELVDSKGTIVFKKKYKSNTEHFNTSFSLKNVSAGIYFLNVEANDDTLIQRVIKE